MDATAPTAGQVLTWDAGNNWWEPAAPAGGGASIPYVIAAFQIVQGTFGSLSAPAGYSTYADLANATQMRLVSNCTQAGAVTQIIEIQAYDGSAFNVVVTNVASSTGLKDSAWQTIPAGCRINSCLLSVYVRNGNGSTPVSMQNINLYVK